VLIARARRDDRPNRRRRASTHADDGDAPADADDGGHRRALFQEDDALPRAPAGDGSDGGEVAVAGAAQRADDQPPALPREHAEQVGVVDGIGRRHTHRHGDVLLAPRGVDAYAQAVIGACERIALWRRDRPGLSAATATRLLMSLLWGGLASLSDGADAGAEADVESR
jgi:hypothetical protein